MSFYNGMYHALITTDATQNSLCILPASLLQTDIVTEPGFPDCFGLKAEDNVNRLFTSKTVRTLPPRCQEPLPTMHGA